MKKQKKGSETPQMRAERLALSKCTQTKSIPNKKKFNKKQERQKRLSFFFVFFAMNYL